MTLSTNESFAERHKKVLLQIEVRFVSSPSNLTSSTAIGIKLENKWHKSLSVSHCPLSRLLTNVTLHQVTFSELSQDIILSWPTDDSVMISTKHPRPRRTAIAFFIFKNQSHTPTNNNLRSTSLLSSTAFAISKNGHLAPQRTQNVQI